MTEWSDPEAALPSELQPGKSDGAESPCSYGHLTVYNTRNVITED